MTSRALDRHVRQLCQTHDITRVVAPGRGRASVKDRRIQHPHIGRDRMAYFVALHEVNHVLIGLQGTRLEREAACWQFAFDRSRIPVTFDIRQRVSACLVRYLARAKENGWAVPAAQSAYWQLLTWWAPPPSASYRDELLSGLSWPDRLLLDQ